MSSGLALEAEGGRWKRYPAYKDSGMEWLGEVPDGWDVIPLRWNSRCPSGDGISSENIETIDDEKNVVPVIGGNGVMGYTSKGNIDYPVLAIGRVGALCGNVHVVQPPAWITDNALVFDADAGAFDLIFLAEVLRSRNLNEIASKTAQPLITGTQVRDQRVPHPTIEEQRAIAAFLDRETGRIDALIAKKERQIELLQEKRTALISHAVTKGLDPDAPMKDSGVEWLGVVPEHWDVKRLKHVCSLIKDGTHQPPSRTSSGIPLLSVRNIINGKFVNLPDDSLISEEDFNELQRSFEVKKNDVLLAIVGATIGKVAIVEEMPPFTIQRSLAVLRPNINMAHYKYFSFFVRSSVFQRLLWKNAGYSAQPGIYLGSITNFNITAPGMNEQRTIAAFLDHETGHIDALTAKVRESISKRREYRTALISAAVTGKIDVRGELVS